MSLSQNNTPVSPALQQRLHAMPKAELHVHIEGATSPETYYQIAERNRIRLSVASLEEWQSFFKFRNFPHFIEVYIAAVSCLKSPEDYAFLIENFYQSQAVQNILYTEAFLSATFLTQKFEDEAILDAIASGMAAGSAKYGVRVNLIPDISREQPDSQTRVLQLALKGKERGLFIGLGLGGLELEYPPELFSETFAIARSQGLRVVAHAGEVAGAASIRGAINSLQAERIGHGIRCIEDSELVNELRQLQIPLEVSPNSNYRLGIVANDQPHPIRQMFDAGLNCTVNSDDPAMFATNLTNEYLTLASQGFTWDELWRLNLNTLKASFLNETEKAEYLDKWERFLSK
ncbi:MAG TPA: adenosine deaminase [Bacillota bacterium]|nr:adenosine deaminase [Bacillota bacterium]